MNSIEGGRRRRRGEFRDEDDDRESKDIENWWRINDNIFENRENEAYDQTGNMNKVENKTN